MCRLLLKHYDRPLTGIGKTVYKPNLLHYPPPSVNYGEHDKSKVPTQRTIAQR